MLAENYSWLSMQRADVNPTQVRCFDSIIISKIFSFASTVVKIRDYLPTYNSHRMSNRLGLKFM